MKNVKQRLSKVKAADPAVSKQIMNDIRTLQNSAVDRESFLFLFKLLEKKWTKEYAFNTVKMKTMVQKFFQYFSRIWVNSEESNWFQAANPQHLTTNNNVEGTNQSFKKFYTGRTRLSFPHMFQKLKHLLQDWARANNADEKFDPEKIPVNTIKTAEEIMKKFKSEAKQSSSQ